MKSEFLDFSEFVPVDTIRHEIMAVGGAKGTGWHVELCDASHPQAVAWSTEQSRKGLKRAAALEAQQLNGRKIKAEEKDPDEVRRDNINWVVSRIVGWSPAIKLPFITEEPLSYSAENAFKVFSHPKMGFALAQLIDIIGDEKSFTKASANGSKPTPEAISD